MHMDHQLLSMVIQELFAALSGGRVDRIVQDEAGNILLSVFRPGMKHTLLLSPDRSVPRLHLASRKHAARKLPDAFVLFLKSHLLRANLVSIGLLNDDRIVEILFRRQGKGRKIVFELFRPLPNIMITDDDHRILACFHPFPSGNTSGRQLALGSIYVPPLKREQAGASNAIERSNAPAAQGAANSTAESLYERLSLDHEREVLRQDLARALRKAVARAKRKEDAVASDLASAERAEEYRTAGDAILKNVREIRKGERKVRLSGYEGENIAVELDPLLSPAENAERYFRRYKKAKIGKSIIAERLAKVRSETARLAELAEKVGAADLGDLRALRTDIRQAGVELDGRGRVRTAAREPLPPGHRVFRFGDWDILVGRNARGNDVLTGKIARPDDLWLHAEGMPGSHVVIRNPRKDEVPSEVLLKAASLAAYYSAGRDAEKVSVAYTPVKYVKKPKGAPAGQVALARRRSLMARPSSSI